MSVDRCKGIAEASGFFDVLVDLKTNGFVKMDLQKRTQEATLSGLVDNMSPTAIFNRFDLSALPKNLRLQRNLFCLYWVQD
jgi:hypothetical protein